MYHFMLYLEVLVIRHIYGRAVERKYSCSEVPSQMQAQQLYALRRKVFIGEMIEYTTGSRNDREVRVGYCNHCR